MLPMGPSYNDEVFLEALFLKMEGRKLYKYALQTVAGAMKEVPRQRRASRCATSTKILIHQANGKMDEAILDALYELDGSRRRPPDVMPMTISWLGNSSVATVPTLLDLILQADSWTATRFHAGDDRALRLGRRGDAHQRVRVPDAVGVYPQMTQMLRR